LPLCRELVDRTINRIYESYLPTLWYQYFKTNLNKHLRNKHALIRELKCECGRDFDNTQSLNAHYRWCLIHRDGKEINTLKGIKKSNGRAGKTYEEIYGILV
jgi:hypothetical protein